MSDAATNINSPVQLVDAEKLLEILFPPECRPTLRWLRERQKKRDIPFVKLGRLIYFNPASVQDALAKQPTAKEK
jgi:uncharacterized protein YbaR (Trm112 family)